MLKASVNMCLNMGTDFFAHGDGRPSGVFSIPEMARKLMTPPPSQTLAKNVVSMGDRAEGLACADPGVRTPISASRICFIFIELKMLHNDNLCILLYPHLNHLWIL